jgi:DNA-binding transcriptional regulator YhcF (GntR family)
MAHFGPKHEQEYQRKAALQREVLEHLKLYSPKKWDTLYTHFAIDRQTNIQRVLHALKEAGYIKVDRDKGQMVTITVSGRARLEENG